MRFKDCTVCSEELRLQIKEKQLSGSQAQRRI